MLGGGGSVEETKFRVNFGVRVAVREILWWVMMCGRRQENISMKSRVFFGGIGVRVAAGEFPTGSREFYGGGWTGI